MPAFGFPNGIVYGWDGTDLQAVLAEALGEAKETTDVGLVTGSVMYGYSGTDYQRVRLPTLDATHAATLRGILAAAVMYGWDGATYSRVPVESSTTPNLRARLYGGADAVTVQAVQGGNIGAGSKYGITALAQLYAEQNTNSILPVSVAAGVSEGNDGTTILAVGPFAYNGTTYDRIRSYPGGVLKVARASAGLSTTRRTTVGAVKASAGVLYWISIYPSAASWAVGLDDSLDGSAATKWDMGGADANGLHIVFDPPIPFTTGIYVETMTNITSITAGYI